RQQRFNRPGQAAARTVSKRLKGSVLYARFSTPRTPRSVPLLEVTNLYRVGLKPTSFSLPDGTCIAVRGPSGAGKTLLMRAIADLDPNEGTVSLNGEDRATIP